MSIEEVGVGVGIAAAFCSVLRYVIKSDTTAIVNGKLGKVEEKLQTQNGHIGRIEEHVSYLDDRVVSLERRHRGQE